MDAVVQIGLALVVFCCVLVALSRGPNARRRAVRYESASTNR